MLLVTYVIVNECKVVENTIISNSFVPRVLALRKGKENGARLLQLLSPCLQLIHVWDNSGLKLLLFEGSHI